MTQVNSPLSVSGHAAPADIPSNIYKPTAPLVGKVVENKILTAPDSPNDVRHLVFDIDGSDLVYLEGQSIGILPPGEDANGKPHKLRLYSIASPAVGDDGNGKTVSLCVKRANTTDPETGVIYKGVCSNYLNDLKPGDEVKITGPVGKSFLMPDAPNAHMIMVGTGTGIAPFRAFAHHRYTKRKGESGQTWIFFGAQTRKDYLYEPEWDAYRNDPTFHFVTAFSREEQTANGRKMYVQERLFEHRKEIFDLLSQPHGYFYICGLRGMEDGIFEALNRAATEQGKDWPTLLEQLKAEKRWHVEVY
jgi:ferredoxin--NADP+ reductase